MRRHFRHTFCCIILLAAAGFGAAEAHADPLVLTFSNPNQTGAPGATITFSASVTNTGATSANPVTIEGIGVTCPSGCPGFNFTGFLTNFNDQTVASGATLGPLPVFSLTINSAAPLGTVYSGTLFLSYGSGGVIVNTSDVPFTLTVVAPTAPIPEPATVLLLGTGLAGVVGAARRRRKSRP